jgi:hypothetical protein
VNVAPRNRFALSFMRKFAGHIGKPTLDRLIGPERDE